MSKILDTLIGSIADKKAWYATEARAKNLPKDYFVVYEEIKRYIFTSSGIVDSSTDVFRVLLDLFEESAAAGKQVLEVTGKDIASFCDELLRDEKTYFEKCRETLNKNVAKKLDN